MESWDDDNFEPEVIAPSAVTSNKWEGEDEEENIKESWEDEEDESKPKEEKPAEPLKTKPKKKPLQEKIAEKERREREERERRLKEQEEEEISAEEKLKRQKESDLHIALETTFGGDGVVTDSSGLNFNASTKEEFEELAETLTKKLQPLTKSTEYPAFTENLIRDLCATLNSFDIKKIKTTIDNLYLEKQKIEKGDKIKKSKGKAKAKIKVEDANQYSAYVADYNDDYDDFM